VRAWSEETDGAAESTLVIEVADTGVGASEAAVAAGRARGVGLDNVQRRLRAHYGAEARLSITSRPGQGTRVALRLPGSPVHRVGRLDAGEMAGPLR
jgi:two-component system LytT family sensor kinase